jgi:hypothetical protein
VPGEVWDAVATSADGGKSAAVAANLGAVTGPIFTSDTAPLPRLNLESANNKLLISWLVPSINFQLQQGSNLSSWLDVTNIPTLNLTNLQDQITLSPSNSSGFFRLSTP